MQKKPVGDSSDPDKVEYIPKQGDSNGENTDSADMETYQAKMENARIALLSTTKDDLENGNLLSPPRDWMTVSYTYVQAGRACNVQSKKCP